MALLHRPPHLDFSAIEHRRRARKFGSVPKRTLINEFLLRNNSKLGTILLIIFCSAATVGVIGLVLGTTLKRETPFQEHSRVFSRKVTPSKLHFKKLSEVQKKDIAGQIHYLSQKVTERARYRPNFSKHLASEIFAEASLAGIDPLLVTSIIYSESAFKPKARSHMHAYGLMQLQPATAKFTAKISGQEWRGTHSLTSDTRYNMRLGIAYLQYLRRRYNGDLRKALIAYNWGPTNYDRSRAKRSRVPRDVNHYADSILKRHTKYHLSYLKSKSQYQHMNASYVPESFWQSLRS